VTVTTTNSSVEYIGNGVAAAFIGTFPLFEPADVRVYLDDVATFSFVTSGDTSTAGAWRVTLLSPPASGVTVTLTRDTPETQTTEYAAYGRYQAEQVEADFDKLTMALQDLSYIVANPPPIVFPVQTAAEVPFQPTSKVAATNVQSAIEEVVAENDATDALLVPKSTTISSTDTDTLVVTNPTLADNVILTTRTNIALGLVKLDATGHIPGELLQTQAIVFIGMWSPASQGSTPPATGTNGDFYLFGAAGNMSLREADNQQPHTVAVFANDYMVYNTDPIYSGWYYVHSAQQQVITASGVTFQPVGSLSSSDVQSAITELDASLSNLFIEESSGEISIYRRSSAGLEPVILSDANGVRLLRAGQDILQTWANGVYVRGSLPISSAQAQATSVALLTSDGVLIGEMGFLGDQSFYIINRKPGGGLRLAATTVLGGYSDVLLAVPGSVTLLYAFNAVKLQVFDGYVETYGTGLVAALSSYNAHLFRDPSGVLQARLGFIGNNDFYILNDIPGRPIRLQLYSGEQVVLEPGLYTVTPPASFSSTVSSAVAPTAPQHLTRKDYVDNKLSGFISADTVISAGFSVPHNLGGAPTSFTAQLVNVTAQAGYVPGDYVLIPTIMGSSNVGYAVGANATQIWFARSGAPAIIPKVGGAVVSIIEANWRVRLIARL
jgi:hypothetical protein